MLICMSSGFNHGLTYDLGESCRQMVENIRITKNISELMKKIGCAFMKDTTNVDNSMLKDKKGGSSHSISNVPEGLFPYFNFQEVLFLLVFINLPD